MARAKKRRTTGSGRVTQPGTPSAATRMAEHQRRQRRTFAIIAVLLAVGLVVPLAAGIITAVFG